jgi:fructokinase
MIVGIGEVLWDIYPDGTKVAGGAPFNFAFHCKQLGHGAAIVSRVGNDDLGRQLREEVRRLGLSDELIQTDRDHPTGRVDVSLDSNKVPTYTIAENVAWDHIEWDDRIESLAEKTQAVCFGSLLQRTGTPMALYRLVDAVRSGPRGLVVFDVNLRGSFYSRESLNWGFSVSNWRKLNSEELEVVASLFEWGGISAEESLAYSLDVKSQTGLAILTRGDGGCLVHRRWKLDDAGETFFKDETLTESGVPARVVDTVGAGDAFTAAMVCLHLEKRPLAECIRFANHYAARVCEHRGGTPSVDRAEVEKVALASS